MIRPIGQHLDALYLSVKGQLPEFFIPLLRSMKAKAAENEENRTIFFEDQQIPGGPLYIHARGTRGYEFVFKNRAMYLQVGTQKHFPGLMIQFMAETLYEYDIDGLEKIAQILADYFLPEGHEIVLNRVDIALDFQSVDHEDPFKMPDMRDVVSRARRRRLEYSSSKSCDTMTLGTGGHSIQFQVYNKTKEIAYSHKQWMIDVWRTSGEYQENKPVWRTELRLFRDGLHTFGMDTFQDLRTGIGDVVAYACDSKSTGSWVRFSNPDSREERAARREPAEWWVVASEHMSRGLRRDGRRRLRPKALTSFSRAMDMYLAWAGKCAALARAGGLHNASGPDFGKWLFVNGQYRLSRNKSKTWAEHVNDHMARIPDLENFAGVVFDLCPPRFPPEHRRRRLHKVQAASFSGSFDLGS